MNAQPTRCRTRRASRTALGAVALLAGVGLAACSGSTDEASRTTTVVDSIAPEVEAACQAQAKAFDERGPFPLESFDPEHPDPEQLPTVGEYFDSGNHIGDTLIATLEELSPPAAEKARLEALIEANQAQMDMARTQQAAAKAKDVDAFVATLPEVVSLQERQNEAAEALGATSCVEE